MTDEERAWQENPFLANQGKRNAWAAGYMTACRRVTTDVARLVVAARKVAFEDQSAEALRELDHASEAFADRVPWDKQP